MSRIWLRESSAYLTAQRDYILMYQMLRKYWKPKDQCLADWMCTMHYRRLLKEFTGPILERKKQAEKWLKELEKRK